jgi:predicted ATP-grasp superfamily ATP-dependent carboligase
VVRAGAVVIGGDYRGLGVVRCLDTFVDPALESITTRLRSAMRYSGLVEVEFKRDPRDGRPKLLDVSPWIWGWHTLGQRARTEFAYLQWQLSHGEPCPDVHARPSVRWVRLTTDVLVALREVAGGRLAPGTYLRSLRGPLEYAVLATDDILPALAEVPQTPISAAARRVTEPAHGAQRTPSFAARDHSLMSLAARELPLTEPAWSSFIARVMEHFCSTTQAGRSATATAPLRSG